MQSKYSDSKDYAFISYAHKDSFKVIPIIEELGKRGFRVWYDSGIEAGTEWPEYIARSLEGCSCVIAFISEYAQASQNCRREITYAINADKPVLVVYLDDCVLSPGMQLQLGTLHAIYRNRHTTIKDFMDNLCKAESLLPCLETDEQEKDVGDTYEQLQKKAMAGDAESQYELGMKQLLGEDVPQDENEAVIWFTEAAKKGHAPAIYQLARAYHYGIGLPENAMMAMNLYRRAAERNYAKAELAMYLCVYFGVGMNSDREAARAWCRRAAEHGNDSAQYYMGDYCMNDAYNGKNSEGMDAARAEAIRWYTLAAEQGNVHAQFALYTNSRENKDIKWCISAAEQGLVDAQYKLATCYELGNGVAADYAESFKWLRRAAEQGHSMAIYALARCYYLGKGVQRDHHQAAIWFAKAACEDNIGAKRYLDLLSL